MRMALRRRRERDLYGQKHIAVAASSPANPARRGDRLPRRGGESDPDQEWELERDDRRSLTFVPRRPDLQQIGHQPVEDLARVVATSSKAPFGAAFGGRFREPGALPQRPAGALPVGTAISGRAYSGVSA